MNKKKYVLPQVKDLSGRSVCGQDPEGHCRNGFNPTSVSCTNGGFPSQDPSCSPTGLFPSEGQCADGSIVSSSCVIGSIISGGTPSCLVGASVSG